MFRNRIPLWASAFALALFCLPQSGEAGGGVVIGPGSGVCDSISRNPVLIYDVTGGTLIGLVHRNLVVYDDGTATISKRDETVFPAPFSQPAEAVQVQPAVVRYSFSSSKPIFRVWPRRSSPRNCVFFR